MHITIPSLSRPSRDQSHRQSDQTRLTFPHQIRPSFKLMPLGGVSIGSWVRPPVFQVCALQPSLAIQLPPLTNQRTPRCHATLITVGIALVIADAPLSGVFLVMSDRAAMRSVAVAAGHRKRRSVARISLSSSAVRPRTSPPSMATTRWSKWVPGPFSARLCSVHYKKGDHPQAMAFL